MTAPATAASPKAMMAVPNPMARSTGWNRKRQSAARPSPFHFDTTTGHTPWASCWARSEQASRAAPAGGDVTVPSITSPT